MFKQFSNIRIKYTQTTLKQFCVSIIIHVLFTFQFALLGIKYTMSFNAFHFTVIKLLASSKTTLHFGCHEKHHHNFCSCVSAKIHSCSTLMNSPYRISVSTTMAAHIIKKQNTSFFNSILKAEPLSITRIHASECPITSSYFQVHNNSQISLFRTYIVNMAYFIFTFQQL